MFVEVVEIRSPALTESWPHAGFVAWRRKKLPQVEQPAENTKAADTTQSGHKVEDFMAGPCAKVASLANVFGNLGDVVDAPNVLHLHDPEFLT